MYDLYAFQANAATQPLTFDEVAKYVKQMMVITKEATPSELEGMRKLYEMDWQDKDLNMMFAANSDRIRAFTNMMIGLAQWNIVAPEQQMGFTEIKGGTE